MSTQVRAEEIDGEMGAWITIDRAAVWVPLEALHDAWAKAVQGQTDKRLAEGART